MEEPWDRENCPLAGGAYTTWRSSPPTWTRPSASGAGRSAPGWWRRWPPRRSGTTSSSSAQGRPTDYGDGRLFADPDRVPAVAELRERGEVESIPATRLVDEVTKDLYK